MYLTVKILLMRIKHGVYPLVLLCLFLLMIAADSTDSVRAQSLENKDIVLFNRGRLWHLFHYGQECMPMSDWQRMGIGLDWPGFDPGSEYVPNIGGSNSYLVSGGFFITSLNDTGAVQGWDNFATNGMADKGWQGDFNRYLVKYHQKRWSKGENYWLATDPFEAEEVMDSYIEFNGAWYQPWDNQPIRVGIKRTARQWSGSRTDEDYIIIEYTFRNTQRRDPLEGLYILFTYALSPNNRGWSMTFPNLPPGARNTQSIYNEDERLLLAWAGDFKDTPNEDESFDYYRYLRYNPLTDRTEEDPEFIAPGKMGIKFLYISPDSTGIENHINQFVWSAAAPTQDHSGPFLGVAGLDNKYRAMANPLLLSEAFTDENDPRMASGRLYANFSLGPFNIPRRDSIKVVIAEFVGGISYREATQKDMTIEKVRTSADSAIAYLNERIQFVYDQNYIVPMPPPPPKFDISSYNLENNIANLIAFGNESENIPDPHQGIPDLAGYRIYRSWNLPFGPWEMIADIKKGDPAFYDSDSSLYRFIDTGVALGYDYYYSLTAYDSGHTSWAIDPAVTVPPLESSLFAGIQSEPFTSTLSPTIQTVSRVAVVPNPFYRQSGLPKLGSENRIQFVNLPEKCTIRIFTIRGDLVKTIYHNNTETGVAYWNQISENGQFVKSGMYFYHIENPQGEVNRGKFAIIK